LLSAAVPDTANEVGWPQFASTVEGVVASLPADERAHAVILTNAYSEASPLILLGTGLPPISSGDNGYWSWGPPPDDRTVVVHVGDWRPADWSQFLWAVATSRTSTIGSGSRTASRGRCQRHLETSPRSVEREPASDGPELTCCTDGQPD
jgi:hypothetical protein